MHKLVNTQCFHNGIRLHSFAAVMRVWCLYFEEEYALVVCMLLHACSNAPAPVASDGHAAQACEALYEMLGSWSNPAQCIGTNIRTCRCKGPLLASGVPCQGFCPA